MPGRNASPQAVDRDGAKRRGGTHSISAASAVASPATRCATCPAGRPRRGSMRVAAVDQGHGAGLGVEFGRGVVVGKFVGEVHDQRRLVVPPLADSDADTVANRGAAPSAATTRRGQGGFARRQIETDRIGDRNDAGDGGDEARNASGGDMCLQSIHQVGVADVVAKGGEADLAGVEGDLGSADEVSRRRRRCGGTARGLRGEQIPCAEPFQEVHGAREQAAVRSRPARGGDMMATAKRGSSIERRRGRLRPAPTTMMSCEWLIRQAASTCRPVTRRRRRHNEAGEHGGDEKCDGRRHDSRFAMAGPGQSPETPNRCRTSSRHRSPAGGQRLSRQD